MSPPARDSSAPRIQSYASFQRVIDDLLHKEKPDSSIPWRASPRPIWTMGFQPKRIIDLGCATGRFTSAVLTRLGQWGCLGKLETLTLVDKEPGFPPPGGPMGNAIRRRCHDVLRAYSTPDVIVELRNEEVRVVADGLNGDTHRLKIGCRPFPPADLIIASHFTYYFRDDGADLLTGLARELSRTGGLAWVIVRKRACPIYRERMKLLGRRGRTSLEGGYAEDLEARINSGDPPLRLIESRDQFFLPPADLKPTHLPVINLLMWRESYEESDPERQRSTRAAAKAGEHLFAERHLIVAGEERPVP
jgi:SAM-dependent methyltransferase